jgi:parallel beta-helix repeat protein
MLKGSIKAESYHQLSFIKIPIFLLCVFLLTSVTAHGATFYVSPSGSGSSCSDLSRCTLSTGLGTLSAGDTLVLGDGTYNTYLSTPDIPSGTAGNYITIKAENDGLAVISNSTPNMATIYSYGMSYVQFEGLKIVSNIPSDSSAGLGAALSIGTNAHHNKFLRCGFVTTPCGDGNSSCINRSNVSISGNYNLIEDSWAWGGGRYKVLIFGGDSTDTSTGSYNILRRVVVRHDREYSGSFNPQGGVQIYQAYGTVLQNVLVLDSDQEDYYDSNCHLGASCFYGAFMFAKGTKGGPTDIYGSMALHFSNANATAIDEGTNTGAGAYGEGDYPVGAITVDNFVAYDGTGGFHGAPSGHFMPHVLTLTNSLMSNIDSAGSLALPEYGTGFYAGDTVTNQASTAIATNTIFSDIVQGAGGDGGYALYNVLGESDNNVFYGNNTNYGLSSTSGANDITTTDPIGNLVNYPVRVESGDSGPTILYKMGESGTLYGEPGYDTLTTDELWPWPNEDRIKADMSSYPLSWPADGLPSPVRGFTSTGPQLDGTSEITLTSYVWETLGNQMPSDLYDGSVPAGGGSDPTGDIDDILSGTIYYVRTDGSDGNNGLTNSSSGAFKTIQHCSDSVGAGENCVVQAGNYSGFYVESSGDSGSPITFKANGTVNITAANARTSDFINVESWTGSPADYVVIDGFNVANSTRMGIRVIAGAGVVIQNNTVSNAASNGIFSSDTPSIKILNNTVFGNGNISTHHNIYVSNAASDNCVIRGNSVYSSGAGNGIQLNGDWEMGGDGYIDNAVIENNVVHSNTQKGLSLISIRYGRIQNNIIYSNGTSAGGIHVVEQLGQNYSIDNVIANNTIDETQIVAVRINSGNTGNIVFNNVTIGSVVFEGSGNYQSNNYSGTGGFTDRDNRNYIPSSGSILIDAGVSNYQSELAVTTDSLNVARPQGAGVDIGAYEYAPDGYIVAPSSLIIQSQ